MIIDQNNRQPECYADWLNLQLHVLWCYDHTVAAEPNRATKSIYWGANSAWLVRAGFAQVERNGTTYRANAGEWLIVPKGTFARKFADSTHLLSIGYNAQWPDGQLLFDDGLPLVIRAAIAPYLEGRRVEQAIKRLSLPNASPKEIAYDLGFKHLSYFSTWFKRTTGSAPRHYMRSMRV